MLKTVFRFFVMGVTVLVAANSSHASSFEYIYGQLRPTAEAAPISTVEPLAFVEDSNEQVALTNFFDRISGGEDNGKDDNGKGKGCSDGCVGNWRDNTEVWVGADAYKSIGDMTNLPLPGTLTNSMGAVAGFNTGLALGESRVRGQVGASYGAYDWKGRTPSLLAPGQSDSLEQQTYVTFGLYKRSDVCCDDRISWGVVYDQFFGHQWGWRANSVYLSQLRATLGYAINDCNEVGVWGTFRTNHDSVSLRTPPIFGGGGLTQVRAMNQANAYWKHNWAFGANSTMYIGAFDQADVASWQFGMLNTAPLNHSVSLYGNFNYVVPGSATGPVGAMEEQWNASVGLVFYTGAKAVNSTVSGNKGLALLPVANNGSLLITD